jgi:anti-sigma B factor antagonist
MVSPDEVGTGPGASFQLDEVGGRPVTRLWGEVDLSNIETVQRRLRDTISSAEAPVVIDLSGLRFLDSSGLQMLLRLHTAATQEGRDVRFVVASGTFVAELMEMTRVDDILAVYRSVEDALAAS